MSIADTTKWSRNLSEQSHNENYRARLIEKQRQLLEIKRGRQQQVTPTTTRIKSSRGIRAANATSKTNEKLSESSLIDTGENIVNIENNRVGSLDSDEGVKEIFESSLSEENNQDSSFKSNDSKEVENLIESIGHELNPLKSILNNNELLLFATQPVSPNQIYQCTIIRDKRGIDRSFYPTYYIHLQAIISKTSFNSNDNVSGCGSNKSAIESSSPTISEKTLGLLDDKITNNRSESIPSGKQVFLLGGRKRKRSKTYLIGNDPFDITRENCIAKLKSNVIGTQFNAIRAASNGQRYEILSVVYEANVLGFKGPRKMTVIVPRNNEMCLYSNNNLFNMWRIDPGKKSLIHLKNKTPVWNEDTQSYVLNFHGRVTQASVKNFQLVQSSYINELPKQENTTTNNIIKENENINVGLLPTNSSSSNIDSSSNDTLEEDIAMQFGRVSEKEFTCDVTWPLSILQAFCIALSSFDSKLACE